MFHTYLHFSSLFISFLLLFFIFHSIYQSSSNIISFLPPLTKLFYYFLILSLLFHFIYSPNIETETTKLTKFGCISCASYSTNRDLLDISKTNPKQSPTSRYNNEPVWVLQLQTLSLQESWVERRGLLFIFHMKINSSFQFSVYFLFMKEEGKEKSGSQTTKRMQNGISCFRYTSTLSKSEENSNELGMFFLLMRLHERTKGPKE